VKELKKDMRRRIRLMQKNSDNVQEHRRQVIEEIKDLEQNLKNVYENV
jgi:hypothetical protein